MSAAPFAHLPALLAEFGCNCGAVLRQAGIQGVRLEDPGARLTFDQIGRLAVACEAATGCPHVGLLLGQRAGTSAAGMAGEYLCHAESVGEALRLFSAHLHVHDRGAVVALWRISRRRARIAYVIYHPETLGSDVIADAALAVLAAIMRQLCGPAWLPTEVRLPRAQPPCPASYRAAFRAPLLFDSPVAALDFPVTDLGRPLAGAPRDEQRRIEALRMHTGTVEDASTVNRVLRALARMVPAMRPSGERVARTLGISRRSLHNRLAAEGTCYSALLADLRCEIARQLLEDTRLPTGDIAETLHYASPGAFSRAFRAWTGSTPRAVRQRARARRTAQRNQPVSDSPPQIRS